jgi:hypothetical protein
MPIACVREIDICHERDGAAARLMTAVNRPGARA